VYEGQLEEFVLRMKQPQHEALTLAAGRILAQRIRQENHLPKSDLVTTIPMHWTRRFSRGVNSAAILAEAVASELQLPLELGVGRTIKMVPRQSSLTPSRRQRNMRGVFHISSEFDLRGAHLLVIDDVLTTGATANAFAQALRLAGAEQVAFAVVARGIGVQ
jgi:predicted amidophosphoribosyltransferase